MKKITIKTTCNKMLADLYTPVSIYLRIRDRFPGSVLMESADNSVAENSFSFIGIHPIAGIEVHGRQMEYKFPGELPQKEEMAPDTSIANKVWEFIQSFEPEGEINKNIPRGLMGHTSYEGIHLLKQGIDFKAPSRNSEVPELRYRLYQYIIAIDHFKNEMFLCENNIAGIPSHFEEIEKLIRIKDCPQYPFFSAHQEESNMSDAEFKEIVAQAIAHCQKGELAQLVLSRSFSKKFTGDEFNVYRCLRSINPSPYLFYFDYGDYKIFGSSPESQLIIKNGQSVIHPIAGTVRRSGNEQMDHEATQKLLADPKENAEHDMLVDLAVSELNEFSNDVKVAHRKMVKTYSHVIHLVSEVVGKVGADTNPLKALAVTLPAGTLSGSPKDKSLTYIDQYEPTPRGFYAGCIGILGFNGEVNQAIMIRSFLSRNNQLRYQAGAGIIDQSKPESELQEVYNKIGALQQAIQQAHTLFSN